MAGTVKGSCARGVPNCRPHRPAQSHRGPLCECAQSRRHFAEFPNYNSACAEGGEIEEAIGAFAREPNGGLILPPGPLQAVHRELIVKLAARHRLPAVYQWRYMVADGGLMSYGPDAIDMYRRAATYVDRILKGEKPAEPTDGGDQI